MITTTNSTLSFDPIATYVSSNDETATIALLTVDTDTTPSGQVRGKILVDIAFSQPHVDNPYSVAAELLSEMFCDWDADDAPDCEERLNCVEPKLKTVSVTPLSPCRYIAWAEFTGSEIPKPEKVEEVEEEMDFASWIESVYEVSGSGWRD